jgi:hypothetical protein
LGLPKYDIAILPVHKTENFWTGNSETSYALLPDGGRAGAREEIIYLLKQVSPEHLN